jgi:molybdopterin synthase sulfur carrier subunit
MKTITVRYFAMLRERRGLAQERLITGAATAAALYTELCAQHGFTFPIERLRVALNNDFARWDAPLREGDDVALIPPVAGG